MSEIVYFDMGLIPNYHFGFAPTEKAFKAEMKRLHLDKPPHYLKRAQAGATTHFFSKDNGDSLAIVTIASRWKKMGRNQVSALVAHECIHVWQDILVHMDETAPGKEIEAYAVQRMVQNILFELYPD